MASKDAHLYGQRPASRTKQKEISSSSSLAFASSLSGLIKQSASDARQPPAGRARPKKEDIFATHNKNVKKRALKDLEDDHAAQKHRGRTSDEKADDEASYKRTRRIMEEKARKYDALKRGDIEDRDDRYGVDFDRKWAEQRERGDPDNPDRDGSESESEASDDELVEYVDEFGRTRKGPRVHVEREQRKLRQAVDDADRFTARPTMPQNIIYGDTIQMDAYNPDETIAQQMAELAAKRDKEATPPPDEHFDGRKEARQRGTGFFQFSKDEDERKEQMANLEKERHETDRARRARRDQIDARKLLVAEKKKKIQEKRALGKADRFLDAFAAELMGGEE